MYRLRQKTVSFLFVACIIISVISVQNIFIQKTSAAGSNYYVSTVGSNSYNGLYPTFQSGSNGPWLTIEYAVTQATNGDALYILSGTYTPSDVVYIIGKDVSSDWLTIRNYNDENVIINGTNVETGSGAFYGIFSIYKSNNIRVTGLTFNYSASSGIVANRMYSGDVHQCSYITIDNCTFSNCSSVAFMTLVGNNYITFENNYVYNNQNNWSGILSGQECVSFQGTQYFSINNNTFINNHGINIDTKGGCKDGIICYNYINTTGGYLYQGASDFYGGPGIMVDARGVMTNISVYNNYVTGNNSGISLNNEISSGYYAHIRIYNNVIDSYKLGDVTSITYPLPLSIANSGDGTNINHNISIYSNTVHTGSTNNYATFQIGHGSINQLDETNLKDLYVYNNIFTTDYTGTSYAISGNNLPRSSINLVNNSYYRSSGTLRAIWDSTGYSNQTEWTFGEDATFVDPKYADKSDKEYWLQSDSPCIDTANVSLVPSFDYNGTSRPQGDGYDRGAYEYGSDDVLTGDGYQYWNVSINDPDGDTTSGTIVCSDGSSTSWTDQPNGTFSLNMTNLCYKTNYTVWLNFTDGTCSVYETYWFYTDDSWILNPYPSDGATEISRPPVNLSADITGSDVDAFIYFVNMTPSISVWTLVDSFPGVSSERVEYTTLDSFGLGTEFYWGNTTYTWSINVTDGDTWTNQSFTYTTIATASGDDARLDIDNNNVVSTSDLNVVWARRAATYDSLLDVDGNEVVSTSDLNMIWAGRN